MRYILYDIIRFAITLKIRQLLYKERIMIIVGLFWTIEGLFKLAGLQQIDPKFQGYSWTERYKKRISISWLLLGVLYIIFGILKIGEII